MQRPLSGKVALVTGAGQRLGRSIAEGLAAAGADVAVHFYASREGADEVVARIAVDGNRAMAIGADLTDAATLEPMVDQVERAFGRVDILVNSAALFEQADLLETRPASLDRLWAINARAPYLLSQSLARRQLPRGSGDIINVLDLAGVFETWRHASAYAMTRAALASLTKSLALELAPHVRVNAVAPGIVLPPGAVNAEQVSSVTARIPQGAFGTPADVVQTVLFLLAGPRYLTGQIIAVDGGKSLV
jgi:pteridine reductase